MRPAASRSAARVLRGTPWPSSLCTRQMAPTTLLAPLKRGSVAQITPGSIAPCEIVIPASLISRSLRLNTNGIFDTTGVFGALVLLTVMGVALYYAVELVERFFVLGALAKEGDA